VKFSLPDQSDRMLRAARNQRKSYLGKTLWIFVNGLCKTLV
jgi:hypothetical protein